MGKMEKKKKWGKGNGENKNEKTGEGNGEKWKKNKNIKMGRKWGKEMGKNGKNEKNWEK